MPYKITGKIVDSYGTPLLTAATVRELPPSEGFTGAADVMSNEQTGEFTLFATNPNSLIQIEAFGYKTIAFPVQYFTVQFGTPVIQMEDAVILETHPPKKKDYTWLWIAGGVAAAAAIAVATGNKKPSKSNTTPKKLKAKPQPKTVIV